MDGPLVSRYLTLRKRKDDLLLDVIAHREAQS